MNRDRIVPLLSKAWPDRKWQYATLRAFTCSPHGEGTRLGAWVDWEEGWETYYESGWYLLEVVEDRVMWSTLWGGKYNEMHQVQAWTRNEP